MEISQFFLRNNFKLKCSSLRCNNTFLANITRNYVSSYLRCTIWCSQLGRLYADYYYQFNYHMTVIKDWPNLSANSDENIMGFSKILNVNDLKMPIWWDYISTKAILWSRFNLISSIQGSLRMACLCFL